MVDESRTGADGQPKDAPSTAGEAIVLGVIKPGAEGYQTLKKLTLEEFEAVQSMLESQTATAPKPPKDGRKRHRGPLLPPIHSGDRTLFPRVAQLQAIRESFSTSIQPQLSLWQVGESIDLITPTGVLTVQGETSEENDTLQNYVARHRGPDGLKHLVGLYDVYVRLTQGVDQKQDVEVNLKDILEHLGLEQHARDRDEQARLFDTARYLASTYVSLTSSSVRFSPLIVIESVRADKDGNVWLRYHLGIEFFEARFGPSATLYIMPTPRLLAYHGTKEEHELQLSFFFSERIAEGGGHCSLYFVTLCLLAPLMALDEIRFGTNRTRKALRILFALEQLEKDEWITRGPHTLVDLAIAATVCLDPKTKEQLSPATLTRLKAQIQLLQSSRDKKVITAKRRAALQHLLDVGTADERVVYEHLQKLSFSAGRALLEKLEGQREEER